MKTKTIKLDFYNRIAAHTAADKLHSAFPYQDTKEGADYWLKIYNRLMQIADDGKL